MKPNLKHNLLAPKEELERSARWLDAFARIGAGHVGALLTGLIADTHGMPHLPADLEHWVHGPIVVHAGGWGLDEGHPAHLYRDFIFAERAEIALGLKPYIVGPCEMVSVMYCAMLDAPRSPEIANVYLWAGARAAARKYDKPVEHFEAAIHGDTRNRRGVCDEDILSPMTAEGRCYRELSHAIRAKVAAASRARARQARGEAAAASEDVTDRFDLFAP